VTQDGGFWANCRGWDDTRDNFKTTPVAAFPSNPWALHDTAGNVWEMTSSLYEREYSGTESCPARLSDPASRVMRGGSWLDGPLEVRSARRKAYSIKDRKATLGFRVARTP
jgi:formylglycine-generating enzyme required for sulfatase activity